jgi:hypothetical protein
MAAAADDRILKPYSDFALPPSPFRFRRWGVLILAQISWSHGFCIRRRFFSLEFLLVEGSNLSGFCARFRSLVLVVGGFDPPVRVIRAFLAWVLGFSTLVEMLDPPPPPIFMLHTVLVAFVRACVVGWERSWVARTISGPVSLDLLFLQRLPICCRSWLWTPQATPAASWR